MTKTLNLSAALYSLFLLNFQASAEVTYHVFGVATLCSGTCDSFVSLDIGTQLEGELEATVGPGQPWDHTDIVDFHLPLLNPAMPLEPFVLNNTTTANPLPIERGIVTLRPTGGGLTTGGTATADGALNGTLLFEFTVAPLSQNDAWLIVEIASNTAAQAQLCLFFQTAGCIPAATQAMVLDGQFTLLDYPTPVATPPGLDFRTVAVGGAAQAVIDIANPGGFAIPSLQVAPLDLPFRYHADTCSGIDLQENQPCQLVIAFEPTAPGEHTDQFSVHGNEGGFVFVPLTGIGVPVLDSDSDGVADTEDNCTLISNPSQLDSNGDGYGNACDADLNDDCVVNVLDLGLLKTVFFTSDADADFNGDGAVNAIDLGVMRAGFFVPPGPSGAGGACGMPMP